MIRNVCLAALVASLALVGSVHGVMAQANCTSDTLKAANDCFNKQLDQANADMQAKYQDAETTVKQANGKDSQFDAQLAKSQDAWRAYLAATCDNLVKPYWEEGQLQSVAITSCKLALTRERTSDLANMFHGLWGVQQ